MKLEPNELKEELFSLFTDFEFMTFDEINRKVDQPRVRNRLRWLLSFFRIFCKGYWMRFVRRRRKGTRRFTS
jgi:hypothetical protein